MDINDGEDEVSVSSPILNSIDSQEKEVLAPEDVAWADSCLIEDTDTLESTWNPLKNALLEIISSSTESFNTDGGADIEILPSTKESKNTGFERIGNDFSRVSKAAERSTDSVQDDNMDYTQPSSSFEENLMPVSEGTMQASNLHIDMEHSSVSSSTYNALPISVATANTDDIPDNERTETLSSLAFQGNPFLPTYNEDLRVNETMDSALNLDLLAHDMEQSSDDIFKIWDLNIPTEEDEFDKQLNKALATNSLRMTPSSLGDSEQWKVSGQGSAGYLVSSDNSEQLNVLEQGPLDYVIEGFADMSLNS
ncbi:uncharacterized protein LOC129313682 isoform X2 [Prosopis cineraria]|nr:uncharacterized protein LOC129313682 isoform X2 [Prosopis cineraria]XP_054812964.1 uncharacterized protein LOC129313682 isoform X2 [Prosopis cineraria]